MINVADGPRAVVAHERLRARADDAGKRASTSILHVCCRDRNLLGLQSDLLGAHVLGFRNLVVITGDPPKLGDYPEATAVFDLDSIGLLRLTDTLNHGVDPAGKASASARGSSSRAVRSRATTTTASSGASRRR